MVARRSGGKRVVLSLGTDYEKTKKVLQSFYDSRDELGYQYNADFLKWLIDLGRVNASAAIPTKLRKPGKRSANAKNAVTSNFTILLSKEDGHYEEFGRRDPENDQPHDPVPTSAAAAEER